MTITFDTGAVLFVAPLHAVRPVRGKIKFHLFIQMVSTAGNTTVFATGNALMTNHNCVQAKELPP